MIIIFMSIAFADETELKISDIRTNTQRQLQYVPSEQSLGVHPTGQTDTYKEIAFPAYPFWINMLSVGYLVKGESFVFGSDFTGLRYGGSPDEISFSGRTLISFFPGEYTAPMLAVSLSPGLCYTKWSEGGMFTTTLFANASFNTYDFSLIWSPSVSFRIDNMSLGYTLKETNLKSGMGFSVDIPLQNPEFFTIFVHFPMPFL